MPFIALSNSSRKVEVSVEDFEYLKTMGKWHLNGWGYATNTKPPYEIMHNIVADRMGLVVIPYSIDHIDRNKFNCKRDNIRTATRSEQQANRNTQSNNTSGFQCITLRSDTLKWTVRIQRNKRNYRLGSYVILEEAIRQRNHFLKLHNFDPITD